MGIVGNLSLKMWHKRRLQTLLVLLLCLVPIVIPQSYMGRYKKVLQKRRRPLVKYNDLQGSSSDLYPRFTTSPSSRDPRIFFSNPFGILGHRKCATTSGGRAVTGICYNEVECLMKGGNYANYCDSVGFTGVCCAFVHKKCDRKLVQKVAYFTNPSYPEMDSEPVACKLRIGVKKNTCWVINAN